MSRPDPGRARDDEREAHAARHAGAGAGPAGKRRGTSEQRGEGAADRPAEKRAKPEPSPYEREQREQRARGDLHERYGRSLSLSVSSSDADEAADILGMGTSRAGAMYERDELAGSSSLSAAARRTPARPPRISLPAPGFALVDPAHALGLSTGQDARGEPPSPGAYQVEGQPLVNPPQKTQAAFVGKLYNMLEDDKIRESGMLFWAPDGKSFICPRPQEFSKEVLPNYFKHSNWQSFVRQLNMYSFNKVPDVLSTGTGGDPPPWEFRHPLFQRGAPHMLARIKRKSTRHSQPGDFATSPTEEGARPMAGWMHDLPSTSARPLSGYLSATSPPRDYPGNPTFYDTRGYSRPFEPASASARILHPPPHTASSSMSYEQYQQPPVSAYPPLQPRVIALEDALNAVRAQNAALAHQVGALADDLRHATDELDRERQRSAQARDGERIARQRMTLDTTVRIRRLLDYFQLRAGFEDTVGQLRDELRQQEGQLRAGLDDLQASDALVGMRAPPRSLPAVMHDPRQVQTSHAFLPAPPPPPPFPTRPATTESPAAAYAAPRDPRDPRDPREPRDPRDLRDPRDPRDPRDSRELRESRQPRYRAYDSPVSETYPGFTAARRPPSYPGPAPSSASSTSTYSGAPFAGGSGGGPVQPTTPRVSQAFGQQQAAPPSAISAPATAAAADEPAETVAPPPASESTTKTSISHLLL